MRPTELPDNPPRRGFLRAGSAIAAGLAIPAPPSLAQTAERWTATWGAAPAGPPPAGATMTLSNQTLRLVVHASVGGSRVRIRVSNEMGSAPLNIGMARIALRASGATLVAGTDRQLFFNGHASIAIPAGAALLSDPVGLNVPPFADLAVSFHLPGSSSATSIHNYARQTSYVSTTGNYSASSSLPVQRRIATWPYLTEVDVSGAYSGLSAAAAVVALGDSLTDGQASTENGNRRWPDALARRLQRELGVAGNIGVVNRGLSGNCLLTEFASTPLSGRRALERFDRDVLATSGAGWLFVLIGINDIILSPAARPLPVENLIAGHLELVRRGRDGGLGMIGATLTPLEGQAYFNSTREAARKRFNDWIRSAGAYDAVVDFDRALRDPARPTRLNPAYDSGDHLHPNDAGYQAMAQAVPLTLFT